ncbi:hypothetical protein STEG23_029240, partial [Scotinomys teguina]
MAVQTEDRSQIQERGMCLREYTELTSKCHGVGRKKKDMAQHAGPKVFLSEHCWKAKLSSVSLGKRLQENGGTNGIESPCSSAFDVERKNGVLYQEASDCIRWSKPVGKTKPNQTTTK